MEYQRILSVFLHHPHISPTTHNIIHALLYNCYNQDILARSLVSSITHQLDFINHDLHMNLPLELVQDYWFTLAYDELHPTQLPPSRNQKVEMLLATAYNDVAYQWMTDFLLYPLGKRRQRCLQYDIDWDLEQESEVIRTRMAMKYLKRDVTKRDGPACAASKEKDRIVCTQIIPTTFDDEKFSRFRRMTSIFFAGRFDQFLSPRDSEHPQSVLHSPRNAINLSEEWMNWFDDGRFVLKQWAGRYHIKCLDPDLLQDPMFSRSGPHPNDPWESGEGLELAMGTLGEKWDVDALDLNLVRLHEIIVTTWVATGLSKILSSQMRWVNDLPLDQQNIHSLGPDAFSNVLKHKLSLL